MNSFTISQLENYSGIKAHTIRAWEQRYNALSPERSEGNTRYYAGSQLKRLLIIVSLLDNEHKISELARMSDADLYKMLSERHNSIALDKSNNEYSVLQLIAAGMSYDEVYFEKIFSNCILRMGIRNAYVEVIYPMLIRLGQLWMNDTLSMSREHFITNIIRQKLFSAIDSLPPSKSNVDTWLLFLPEDEFHEIGLLFSHYLIRQAGKKVIYLGSSVPLEIVNDAVKEISPANLLLFLVHYRKQEETQAYINKLSKSFKKTTIHISGNEKLISSLSKEKNISWIRSIKELEKHLQ